MIDFDSFSPSNFSRYVSQSEETDETPIDTEDVSKLGFLATNDIPPLMSLQTGVFVRPTSQESPTLMSFLPMNASERVDPTPIPHHGLGPIQRPNKLGVSGPQSIEYLNTNSVTQTPTSPDMFEQLSQLIYQPNLNAPGSPLATSVHPSSNTSMMTDLASPSIPWTPFASNEWQGKNEPSWLLTNLQSPSISMTPSVQNPFALMSLMNNQQQQQSSQDESPFWSSILNTTPSHYSEAGIRSQQTKQWETFPDRSSSSTNNANKQQPNGWQRMWHVSDPSLPNGNSIHERQAAQTNTSWDLNDLSTDSVVPTSSRSHGTPLPQPHWWQAPLPDQNNDKNSSNHDSALNRDQSRWDFAR